MHDVPMSDTHAWTVVVPLHPSLWSQFERFVAGSPAEFELLAKLQPEPDGWIAHVGCSSRDARDRLEQVWG
jgi:hypothetical protein